MDDSPKAPGLLGRSALLVDGLLRGTLGTDPDRPAEEIVPLRASVLIALPLAAFYGACMGIGVGPSVALANLARLPLILVLASLICLPSFYVFSALTGAPLRAGEAVRSLAAYACLTSRVRCSPATVWYLWSISTPW